MCIVVYASIDSRCLQDCGGDAHAHVLQCPRNLNPNTYYGTPEQFRLAQNARMRPAVQQYIASLPRAEADEVSVPVLLNCSGNMIDFIVASRVGSGLG
jgi:hypothetical protein